MAPFSSQRQYFKRQKFRVMPLMTSSAGIIIYSTLLTKFAVTGHYELHAGLLSNKISTQCNMDGNGVGRCGGGGI
jgi:hypothetical protein